MNFLFYCLLIVAITLSAHAQTGLAESQSASARSAANDPAGVGGSDADSRDSMATELLLIYIANVDGLLRDLADKMRSIAEQVEARELTPLQAQALKLETARSVLGRLETLSAVYDAVLFYRHENTDTQSSQGYARSSTSPTLPVPTNSTVSLRELTEEGKQ